MTFVGLRSVRPRRDPVRCIVLHWTGGARGLDALYRTLRATVGPHSPDGLSVHYGIDAAGAIAEWVPPELVALHAGQANGYSIGFEVCGPGFQDTSAARAEATRGVKRLAYEDRIRGHRVKMLGYTEPQYRTLFAKIDELCSRFDLPRQVPTEADGTLMARQMTPSELARFHGVMGHYHCHETKCDPGTEPFRRLLEHWRNARSEDDTRPIGR